MLVISCSTVNLFICLPAGWTRTTGFCCGVHEASCWCGGLKTRRGTVCVIDFFSLWAQWCYAKEHPLQTKQKTIGQKHKLKFNCLFFSSQDIEFIRAHYSIEDFIYFNYHQREEHGRLFHFTLNAIFRHYTRHFLKVRTLTLKTDFAITRHILDQQVNVAINNSIMKFVLFRNRRSYDSRTSHASITHYIPNLWTPPYR